ncbi:thiamine diphosphate-binding protein [Suillus fuscotomentosus]|uniref:Thiamine diphosphate-binding protein n=1 Tax=Suillus fuscotomentosus TaxID=1912939 RepID=A0AAD4E1R2_9AGAM|nr:thiamine diphosphate-binding protein [Suillus fuscotomentosus]KAG1898119.1 thiamine diphosphate-binding protein [Suillus fuscotomentosus]
MGTEARKLQGEVDRPQQELQTLKAQYHSEDEELITISDYILKRLEQLNVTSIFGVPGDFNMHHPTIQWIGNCNELNAAYAADGYSRVKEHSIGVVVTTFGVGELSATNAIAGAFSEMVPVLHIVGVPSTTQLKNKPMLHHTLGDGRFNVYTKVAEQITAAQAIIMNKAQAAAEIDRILVEAIIQARPVYLTLPMDLTTEKISAKRLKIELPRTPPPNNPDVESYVIDEIVKLVEDAKRDVIILVDACAVRHDLREEVNDLLVKTQFPVYATPMGKTSVSEEYERYGGIYIGSITHPSIKERVENANLILSIGALKSDFNTGMFTYHIPARHTIELHSDHTLVRHAKFPDIGMKWLLPKLTERLSKFQEGASRIPVPHYKLDIPKESDDKISHAHFWPRQDVIVAETGTSNFGVMDVPMPDQCIFVSQILYGSIGWATGKHSQVSLLNLHLTGNDSIAARDRHLGRTILFTGDGSMQLTVQEISTMTHNKLTPIIFVLNNKGYNIERHLHGLDRKYNDIADWKWTSLLTTLGDIEGKLTQSYTVRSKSELDKLLDDEDFVSARKIQLVEVIMDKYDTPRALQASAALTAQAAAGQL